MNINLDYYKVFYTVAKTGSISAAATKLFISQPAVSQAVKHLENALGANLFTRTPKGVRLTREGEFLLGYVGQGYEYFLLAESHFRDMHDLETGEIRIGASDMTLRFYLLPHLERFHSLYPKVKISVTNGPTPETLRFLREGEIDFGLVTTPLRENQPVQSHVLCPVRDCFVANSKFEHLKNRPLSAVELASLPLIMLEKNTSTRRFIDHWFDRYHALAQPEFELATSDLIVQFALRGLGVGFVVRDFATQSIEQGELFELKLLEPLPTRDICLVTSLKSSATPACKKLLEMLLEDEGGE